MFSLLLANGAARMPMEEVTATLDDCCMFTTVCHGS